MTGAYSEGDRRYEMSITGNLRTLEFAELLQWLAQGQKTGALVVDNGRVEKRIYFRDGKIVSSESNNPQEHLGSFMIREGLIDEATLARAVKLQESTQILLGKVLVTLGTITEEALHWILRKKTEESLYELFNWTEGEFRFLPNELPKLPMVPLEIDVTNVVLEGAKRFDEARRDREMGTGDYGREIEDVLGSEVFLGLDDAEADTTRDDAAPTPDAPHTTTQQEPVSTEVRGYYAGKSRTAARKPLLAAAAAAAAIGIGLLAYFLMRPQPASGTADVETVPPVEVARSIEDDEVYQSLLGSRNGVDIVPDESVPEPPGSGRQPAEAGAAVSARYEAELEALKQQLQEAQLAAAERDRAVARLAELENQVSRTGGGGSARRTDANAFSEARLQTEPTEPSFSAGGDEAPPLGTSIPVTDADREASADFATGMVDSARPPLAPRIDGKSAVERQVDSSPATSDPVTAQITPPTLLTRPRPRYPVAAMRMGKEAVVTLRLLIDVDGKVADVERVSDAAGMGFDKAAIEAAVATQWQPGTENGTATEMWTEMRIAFKP